eukprot:4105327-Pyramimonas_sp.AAC.1
MIVVVHDDDADDDDDDDVDDDDDSGDDEGLLDMDLLHPAWAMPHCFDADLVDPRLRRVPCGRHVHCVHQRHLVQPQVVA